MCMSWQTSVNYDLYYVIKKKNYGLSICHFTGFSPHSHHWPTVSDHGIIDIPDISHCPPKYNDQFIIFARDGARVLAYIISIICNL